MISKTDHKSAPVQKMTETEFFEKLKPFLVSCLKLNHDLNNPLAGVIGYAEFVLSEPGQMDPDQIDMLNKVLICADKLKIQLEEFSREKNMLGNPNDIEGFIEEFLLRLKGKAGPCNYII